MDRRRTIEILRLTDQIEAELHGGQLDDADLTDESIARIANLLAAPHPKRRGGRPHRSDTEAPTTVILIS